MINIAIESEAEEPKNEKKTAAQAGSSFVIPVVEEQAQIGKQVVESGRLRITKSVQEQEELVNLALTHEEHHVERVPVNEYVDTPPPPVRYEGETMIIPVLREVVQVRLLVVEELRITKKQVQTQVNQPVTLLKEEVNVEHQTIEPSSNQPA
ncbi:MAG: YsnF/AvaK domain-containing protein [Adhaeribacter sp.]